MTDKELINLLFDNWKELTQDEKDSVLMDILHLTLTSENSSIPNCDSIRFFNRYKISYLNSQPDYKDRVELETEYYNKYKEKSSKLEERYNQKLDASIKIIFSQMKRDE